MPEIPYSQWWKGKKRPPRVHLQYEIQTGNATVKIQLPFVVGVMGNFSGVADQTPFDKRTFEQTDMYTFEELFKKFSPTIETEVDDVMSGEKDKKLRVKKTFTSIDDFTPGKLAESLDGVKDLYEARKALESLRLKAQNREEVMDKLKELVGGSRDFLEAVAQGKTASPPAEPKE